MTTPLGVLLMAYGTPASEEEIEPYYTDIRGGRKPTPELLDELRGRYRAIGGVSPLLQRTLAQAEGLQRALSRDAFDRDVRVYVGMRHWKPRIALVVQQMRQDGIEDAVGLVLAPHYSQMSVGRYIEMARTAAEGRPRLTFVHDFHLHPAFLRLLAQRVREARAELPELLREDAPVIFTAHSLPERIREAGDPYPDQLRETADATARLLSITNYDVGWQSAGRTADPWIGPDILDVLRSLHAKGKKAAVICPCGFVADHLEVLYDLDIEAQALCKEMGFEMRRTRSLNDDPAFMDVLADVVLAQYALGSRP